MSDCIDLLYAIDRSLPAGYLGGTRLSGRLSLISLWNDLKWFVLELEQNWSCGRLLDEREVSRNLAISRAQLSDMVRKDEILWVENWDGRTLFPEVQFESTGTLLAHVPALLASIDLTKVSRWSLALWLGKSNKADSDPRRFADYLRTDAGVKSLVSTLQDFDVLQPGANDPPPIPRVPSASAFSRLCADPETHYTFRGSKDRYESAWTAEGTTDDIAKSDSLYRIVRQGYGPFYFSNAVADAPGGRFDLESVDEGTCYTAFDPLGAINEIFNRLLVVDMQEIATRVLWQLIPFEPITPALDLRPRTRSAERLPHYSSISSTKDRTATQHFAQRAAMAGYTGIVHQLSRAAGFLGLALFGPAGRCIPETNGLGSWHARSYAVIDEEGFKEWYDGLEESGGFTFSTFKQLPLRSVFG